MDRTVLNRCSEKIIGAAMHVHTVLGPGLLESVYRRCLAYELRKRGEIVAEELPLAVVYEDLRIPDGFRADLMVNDLVIVEVKAVAKLTPIFEAIALTYLKMSDHRLALLINFNELRLRDGLKRIVNNF